jgi:hypothetical protein
MFAWSLENCEKFAHIGAIGLGGIWAWFFSGKIYKARLEMTVSGSTFREADNDFLIVEISVKNVGIADLKIDGQYLEVYSLPIGTSFSPSADATILSMQDLELRAAVPALPDNDSIKSAETVRSEQLFRIPPNQIAVMVILDIVGNGFQWEETKVIRVESKDRRENLS